MTTSLALTARRLAGQRGHPCVSVVVPIEPGISQPETANRMLDKELRGLRATLGERWGLATREIEEIVSHLVVRSDDLVGAVEGMAIYVTPSDVTRVPLAHRPAVRVVAAEEPDLVELVAELDRPAPFHVLALTQDSARLWHCDVFGCVDDPVELASRDEALAYLDDEPVTDVHGGGRGGGTQVATHHGGVTDHKKERTRLYFRHLANQVAEVVTAERDLVVVASVPHEIAMFREVCSHHPLADLPVGNPGALRAHDLHARALDVVRSVRAPRGESAGRRFRELSGTGRTEDDLGGIDHAAEEGRIETLLVGTDVVADGATPPNVVRRSVAATLTHGGEVVAVEPADVDGRRLAAILRY